MNGCVMLMPPAMTGAGVSKIDRDDAPFMPDVLETSPEGENPVIFVEPPALPVVAVGSSGPRPKMARNPRATQFRARASDPGLSGITL